MKFNEVFYFFVFSFVLRVLCGILGILVVQENSEVRDQNAKVLVANYTTALDHVAMELVYPNVMVFIT
jgi:ancient ubiquitous protein 1